MTRNLEILQLTPGEIEKLEEIDVSWSHGRARELEHLLHMSECLEHAFVPIPAAEVTEEERIWATELIRNSMNHYVGDHIGTVFLVRNILILISLRRMRDEQVRAQALHSPFIYTLY